MFNKPLDELDFKDIKELKENKIPESSFVDYKKEMIEDKKLVKQICGFANANGGYLIFGVEESDDEPPIPKNLPGLTLKDFNMQRIEQIINTNIEPRLPVEISPPIYKSGKKKCFIVIRVPEGPDKPYMSNITDRFYLRHNFETRPMTEPQISNMYRQRFSTPQTVRRYLKETMSYHKDLVILSGDSDEPIIFGHIFVFPPNIERRRIAKIDKYLLNRNNPDVPCFSASEISLSGDLSLPKRRGYNGFGIVWFNNSYNRLEFHRNGLIHHTEDYGRVSKQWNTPIPFIADKHLTAYFLLTMYFSDWAYKEIKYFGPLNIMLHIDSMKNIHLYRGEVSDVWPICLSQKIIIEREVNSWELEHNYVSIVKSMMDEFMNYFGLSMYWGFQEDGSFRHLLENND
jgi:hypothetical protein